MKNKFGGSSNDTAYIIVILFLLVSVVVTGFILYKYDYLVFSKKDKNCDDPYSSQGSIMSVYVCGINTGIPGFNNVWGQEGPINTYIRSEAFISYLNTKIVTYADSVYLCPTMDYFKNYYIRLGLGAGYKYMGVVHSNDPPETSKKTYYISYGNTLPSSNTTNCKKLTYSESDNPQPLYRNPYNGILSGYKNVIKLSEKNNQTLGPYVGTHGFTGGNVSTTVVYDMVGFMKYNYHENIDGNFAGLF